MHPVLIQLGPFTLHWYGLLVAVGFIVGLWTASRRGMEQGVRAESVMDLGPWLICGAIVGARFLYVISYWEESFAGKPFIEVFMVHHGGLVFYGGFVGAALTTMAYLNWKRLPMWKMADILAPSIALGYAFGRVGCFMNGCCYGKACDLPWAIRFPEGHETAGMPVHPTQFYESGMNLLLYVFLAWLYRNKKYEGQVFVVYLYAYSVLRSVIEVFRGDYQMNPGTFMVTPGQGFSLGILVVATFLHFFLKKAGVKSTSEK